MKHIGILFILLGLFILPAYAQHVPQGMKYQAVARDAQGNIIGDQKLFLRVSLGSDADGRKTDYMEDHAVVTNTLGLFTLTIGEGTPMIGAFEKIPWGENEIWMKLELKGEQDAQFITISNTKLLSVPYAFHAGTASQLIGAAGDNRGDFTGPEPETWNLSGNTNTSPKGKLGTQDNAPLKLATNDLERMRITEAGDVILLNDLDVNGNVDLNTTNGNTTVNGDLTVENMSSTHLTGTLTVDKEVNFGGNFNLTGSLNLHDSLNVLDMAPAHLTGTLKVDKAATFLDDLDLFGSLHLRDSLNVLDMAPTHLTGTLTVEQITQLNDKLNVTANKTGFVAMLENTNTGNGDGLRIKLGKTHPRWMDNPPVPFSNTISAQIPGFTFYGAAVDVTKDLIKGLMISPATTFSVNNFTQIGFELKDALETELGASLEDYASAACNLTKDLIGEINGALNLPWNFPGLSTPPIHVSNAVTIFGGLDLGALGEIPKLVVPAVNVPSANIINSFQVFPLIPQPTCPPPPSLSSWTLPNFRLTDVPNSLGHENQYIQFVDKDDRQVGAIRAESIQEWCDRYLTLTYFLNVFNSFAGVTVIGLDPTQIAETLGKYAINGLAQIANVADAYNSIGVEYSSGFGDYAEWLERADPTEMISPGDIVAVKGGKISRDLTNAEQVMAVSSRPIVLGNTPPSGKESLGNKIAFMGQIPVKVMGPVSSGDFIVAQSDIPGYGIAVHPADMTPEYLSLSVGRSWDACAGPGPKLVNTVVGVHNGDYIHILKQFQQKMETTDQRLSSIEEKMELLFPTDQTQTKMQ